MDITCRVCAEPWFASGVRKDGKGDMAGWEAELFLKGAGCPCCEGEAPEGIDPDTANEQGLRSLLTGGLDDYGHLDPLVTADLDKRPKWERPTNPLVWECDGCGVKVRRDLEVTADDEYAHVYDVPRGCSSGWYEYLCNGPADPEPCHVFPSGAKVCERCHASCRCCGADVDVSRALSDGDPYGEGWCGTLPDYGHGCGDVYCMECVESTCSDCGGLQNEHTDDCECCGECGATCSWDCTCNEEVEDKAQKEHEEQGE